MSEYQDFKINIKIRLAALWTTLMFCYIYGDFFTLFLPGHVKDLINGQTGNGPTTPTTLLLYAILLSLPALMIFLSVTLKPKTNRIVNMVAGSLYTAVMIVVITSSVNYWMAFYIYLGVIEVILTCTIVKYAWSWPKAEPKEF